MKRIVIQPHLYFLLPLLILFPNGWLISWVIAAAVHECFHILALYIYQIRILTFEIRISGAKIITEPIAPGKELVITILGPIGSLILLGLSPYYPEIAICALVQSSYNLLPVYPLDGGRIVRCLLIEKVNLKRVLNFERYILWTVICVALFIGIRYRLTILSIILSLSLLAQHRNANRPCKDEKHRVQ